MTTQIETPPHHPIPRKLDNGMIQALSLVISKGNYAVTACQLCGIYESTLYDWIKQAEQDEEEGLESIYTSLNQSLKKAEAEAEALMVETARNAAVAKKDGYLAITVNERRHPDRWGRKDRTQIDVTETKVIQIVHETLVIKELPGQVIEGEVRELKEGE